MTASEPKIEALLDRAHLLTEEPGKMGEVLALLEQVTRRLASGEEPDLTPMQKTLLGRYDELNARELRECIGVLARDLLRTHSGFPQAGAVRLIRCLRSYAEAAGLARLEACLPEE